MQCNSVPALAFFLEFQSMASSIIVHSFMRHVNFIMEKITSSEIVKDFFDIDLTNWH